MVSKCLNSLLTEAITAANAYETFYKDKLPEDIWNILMNGAPNMTPFHKKVAEVMVNYKEKKIKRGYSENQVLFELKQLAELAEKCWNKNERTKQFLTNAARENFDRFGNRMSLMHFLGDVYNSNGHTENEFLANGLYTAYEDDTLLVTVTLSYTASHKYYSDSHWCTASGIDGRWDGFTMFKNYTRNGGLLVQFVDKTNRAGSFQTVMLADDDDETTCDFMDRPASFRDIEKKFGIQRVTEAATIIEDNEDNLREKMRSYSTGEQTYYTYASFLWLKNSQSKLVNKYNNDIWSETMKNEFAEVYTPEENDDYVFISNNSFVFSDMDRTYEYNGLTYQVIFCQPRLEYYTGETDDEGNDILDTEAMKNSFFNDKERNVMFRVGADSYTKGLIIAKDEDNGKYEIVATVNAQPKVIRNRILITFSPNGTKLFVDIVTGKIVFTLTEKQGLSPFYDSLEGFPENTIVFCNVKDNEYAYPIYVLDTDNCVFNQVKERLAYKYDAYNWGWKKVKTDNQ